jgi:3-oxoacyl-[acyl-carrier protein] reductase
MISRLRARLSTVAQGALSIVEGRNEWKFFAVLPRADRPLAIAWWVVLILRGVLPGIFAVAMGLLVSAVQAEGSLAGPLALAGAVFLLLQVLPPVHQAIGANLGDRTAAWLYDRLTDACVQPPGMGHLEDPKLTGDLTVARDFDLGMTGPPLFISVDFIAAGLIEAAIERFGRLDILVNNASVRREVDFASLDYREWREILATTLDGAYLCSRAALPHLIASGAGAIVNIGGLSAHIGAARPAHVIAAKAGLVGLTRARAHDLAPHRITVNCVAPGMIETARTGAAPAHHAGRTPPVGRKGTPEEIAALVRFLCGPGARYITGQTIHANGGTFM